MHTEPSRPAFSKDGPLPSAPNDLSTGARLLVVLLALAWGFNWIAAAFALKEVPVWTLRFIGTGIGAATLVAATWLSGRSLRVPQGALKHILIAGFCNVAVFNVCSALAQVYGATSRAIIITYSMPIWTSAGAWLVLGDRLDRVQKIALVLCVTGLSILIWPLTATGVPLGVLFALGCALSWSIANIYLKWAKVDVDPLVNAAWQLTFGTLLIMFGMLAVEGHPHIWPISTASILAILYIGVLGVGLAHFLWWVIVAKLPTSTAAIGSLLVPVVGICASAAMLGERPSIADMIGFASIFAAAACVLLRPATTRDDIPE